MASAEYAYAGGELEVFAEAHNWKRYFAAALRPYVRGQVLEVGAGLGGTTRLLRTEQVTRWVCLEPDPALAARIAAAGPDVEVRIGTTEQLSGAGDIFDTILYVDVLEHIERDRDELQRAAALLRPGAHLAVVAPAHGFLFSPFDEAIGHHRRYDRRTLRAVAPRDVVEVTVVYLDSLGMLLSIGNRVLLRSPRPSLRQVAFWDSVVVPLSRRLDPMLGNALGKSVMAVWRKVDRQDAEGGVQ